MIFNRAERLAFVSTLPGRSGPLPKGREEDPPRSQRRRRQRTKENPVTVPLLVQKAPGIPAWSEQAPLKGTLNN